MLQLRLPILYGFNNHLRLITLILFLNQQVLLSGKSGFAAEQTKITKEMGPWFFARMSPVRTVPACQRDVSPAKRKGLLSMIEDCSDSTSQEVIAGSSPSGFSRAQVRAAVSYYRSLAQISEDADPLLFWKANDVSGSILAPLVEAAAEVLAIPATEAICERIFRRAGEVLTKYRMSLLGRNFEHILMANHNAPKWQGVKGVDIPVLNEVDDSIDAAAH